ncbi:Ger(x)C family spore germination protein [Parageobacillus toebii NBRC 107807]|uniref:Spore germination protein KC n=1 Tax=Parageobacillus toebii NBRC 107807 TaxID=1223503 RepID=A0A6G9J4M3_9BACL|nr:Ger(x)C family spore germination protein [Parageobacillus toebii]MBB3869406.1 spore germination protein KC [Parageobacillus toebii NBRC 107807]QIQ33641.1 Ger(x)C family spore germination protein [Parageobacillus toebii NBRC 107807]
MKRKIAIIISLLLCATVLSGCWSAKELNELAFVVAVGIDKTKDGKYVMIFQVVNPGNVVGARQNGGGSGGVPVSIYKATGDNLVEASRKASKKLSRLIYYAHTNLFVISEEVAKEGVNGLFDALERNSECRSTAMVVIARHHSAEEVLKILTPIDKIPANQIIKTLQFSEKIWGQSINVDIGTIINDLASPGKAPIISGVEIVGSVQKGKRQTNVQASEPDARLNINGLAMFKEDKLVGWISGETARGVVWILDKMEQTGVTVEKEDAAYKVVRAKTSVAAHMKKGKPSISIHIQAEGDIGEEFVSIDFTNPKQIFALEKKAEKSIKKEVVKAIEEAKKAKTDIFGFGDIVYRSYPQQWKTMKSDWHDRYFPQLEVNVTVEAFIRRTGLRTKSYLFGQ